jgi:CRISPR-associated protein Cas2
MKADYLVCYDIKDERRLQRVCRYLKGKGLHLQYSVFLCSLRWPELKELKAELTSLIDEKQDDVRLYPLPARALVAAFGRAEPLPKGLYLLSDRKNISFVDTPLLAGYISLRKFLIRR